MRSFGYEAWTDAGRRRRGVIVAESAADAARRLAAQGLHAGRIEPRAAARRRLRLDGDGRTIFTRQMAVLLSAGLPVEAALDAIGSGTTPAVEAVAADVKAAVLDGAPLSEALSAVFPRWYVAALGAGEVSGDLAAVFEGLAGHLETRRGERSVLATALIYPAFVAAVSLIVAGVLMTTVAPEIVAMFEVTGRPLPGLTQAMLAVSDFVGAAWPWLLAAGLGGPLALALALRRPALRDRWDRAMLRLPLVGRLMRQAAAAQYLRTLALVIASRQPVAEAAAGAAEVLTVARFRAEAAAVGEAVRQGEALWQALARLSVLPPVARQLIRTGEASARLAVMAERAAVLVEDRLTTERKRIAALLDPLLMMVVGGMVLTIVLAILLPIFDLQAVVAG